MGLVVTASQCATRRTALDPGLPYRPRREAGDGNLVRQLRARPAERWDMSPKTATRLTPRERLTRGLTYCAVGPVDVTRGTLGLGVSSAHTAATRLRAGYER